MDVSGANLWLAFGLTLMAGLATGVGSLLALFAKRTNTRFLSLSLGFSAGVMIYVSFVEILAKARASLEHEQGPGMAAALTVVAFFAGMAVVALIDQLVPKVENPHEMHRVEEMRRGNRPVDPRRLMRMGLLSALAIAIHNFPEGLATFMAALQSPSLGIAIAVAIAIHNVPEGIAVAVPVFYATGSRRKAFAYSFLSGVSEPVGALVGYLLLMPFLSETLFGIVFAGVAGVMVFISFDELLPSAEEYGEHHLTVYGLIAGMAVMAVSLLML